MTGDSVTIIPVDFPQPDMGIIADSPLAEPIFPMLSLPPSIAAWAKEKAKGASSPTDYILGALFACASGIIGNSCRVAINPEWSEAGTLWVALVGTPSQGKTPALKPVTAVIKHIEGELNKDYKLELKRYNEKMVIAKSALKAWEQKCINAGDDLAPPKPKIANLPPKPIRNRLMVQDCTIEKLCEILSDNPKGIIQYRDELAGWLTSMSRYKNGAGSDRPFWLESWSGGSHSVDRVKHDEPVEVENLCISILGGIQPDKIRLIINDADDGLASRFLYFWPRSVEIEPYTESKPNDILERLINKLHGLEMPKNGPHFLQMVDYGGADFLAFRRAMKRACAQCVGPLAGFYGKAAGTAARFALVITLMEWAIGDEPLPPSIIPEATIHNAMQLMKNYFIPMACRVFDKAGAPVSERYSKALALWLLDKRPPSINKRDIYKIHRIPMLNSAKKAELAINELVEAGWLFPDPKSKEGPSIRKREDYLVNPQLGQGG